MSYLSRICYGHSVRRSFSRRSTVHLLTTVTLTLTLYRGGGNQLQSLVDSLFWVSHSYQSILVDLKFFRVDLQFSRADLQCFWQMCRFWLLEYFWPINHEFVLCLPCMLMREDPTLSMCRHSNEGNPLNEHVQSLYWACAHIIMRGNYVSRTETLNRDTTRDWSDWHTSVQGGPGSGPCTGISLVDWQTWLKTVLSRTPLLAVTNLQIHIQ